VENIENEDEIRNMNEERERERSGLVVFDSGAARSNNTYQARAKSEYHIP
jgi:hypothetical protein